MPLIGNRFLEHDLRAWLDGEGYYGRSAEVEELELAAVQRPGWVQVFRFRLRAKHRGSGEWDELRGLARDDERVKKKADRTAYRLTPTDAAHDAAFAEWSDGLITLRKRRRRGDAVPPAPDGHGEAPAGAGAAVLVLIGVAVLTAAVAILAGVA